MIYSTSRIHQLTELMEKLADSTAAALGNIMEELIDMRAVVIQNRIPLDIILAKEDGICHVIHQSCCAHIPDNSDKTNKAIGNIKKVQEEAKNVHTSTDLGGILGTLGAWFGNWTSWLIEARARGQATKHGGRELLELRAAFGSSSTTRGDRGDTSLLDQPGWSLGDSRARLCHERTLGGSREEKRAMRLELCA
ncbi:hypothetical protein NDU88_004179 [Pleurodeles waltl]|uniref:Uncharacterized protein n=1 Tax=Pleurodeles waltl TaxID=8319 RepID=A0AAV7SI17_PLEWA|nr:hypothetical protein NDU88_004179 [Pleurodeles waltl]